MATKAERARAEAERSGPDKPKQPKRRKRTRAIAGTADAGKSSHRNLSDRAAKKGGAAQEISVGPPSRKSTRRSAGRIKRTTNQQVEAVRRSTSPQARAARAAVPKR